MIPVFGEVFGEPIPAYFTMLMVGFVVAVALGVRWARRHGYDHDVIIDLGLVSLVAGVAGARLASVLFDGHLGDYVALCTDPSQVAWTMSQARCGPSGGVWDAAEGVCHPAQADCWAWARFWEGGLVWYGGVLGAAGFGVWLLRWERFPVAKALDLCGMIVPLGLFFGRLGCFFAGCCFGIHTDHWTALSFPPASPASEAQYREGLLSTELAPSLPVLPTQLFEAAGALAIAAVMMLLVEPRKRFDGQVFVLSMGAYAVLRFLLELVRADERGALGWFTTSQWIGLLGLVVLAWLWRLFARRARARMATPLAERRGVEGAAAEATVPGSR
ncbi:MAG: prolipoprotein diacylglyceryl transferase [Sandaracinaceae bacterium]